MKRDWLKVSIAGLLLVIWGLIVVHAPITVWLTSNGLPDSVKAWKEVLMAVAAVLLLVYAYRKRKISVFRNDTLIWAAGMYGLLHLIMAFCLPMPSDAMAAGLGIDLRYILYFVLVYVFIKLAPEYLRSFKRIGGIGAIIVIGFACIQLFLPVDALRVIGYGPDTIAPYMTVDDNPDFIRHSSTLRGPNPLGAYAGSVLVLLASWLVMHWRKGRDKQLHVMLMAVMALVMVALWVSYSRSALVGAAAGLVVVLYARASGKINWKHWITIGLAALVVAVGVYTLRDTALVSNVILHNDPETGATVDSNTGHAESLVNGWQRMLEQPFGAGIGSTGSASLLTDSPAIIENQYLMIAHEAGWLGLGLFLWLFYLVMVALWRRRHTWQGLGVFASGINLALIGILLPVWADDTVSIVWWGLAALVIATTEPRSKIQ